VSENKSSVESWSAETKFAVVLEAAGLSEIDLGEYCRRKGLYPEQITAWRQAFITGQKSEKAQQKDEREQSRKDKKRIQDA
jgi:transposase-like protein